MLHITIIHIGERKKGSVHNLASELETRLRPYAKLEFKSVKEEPFRSPANRERVFKEEAARIREKMNKDSVSILLTEHGDEFTSEQFAEKLNDWSENGTRHLEFIIAGPLGMDPKLKDEVNHNLALSKMTFPHDIAHLLLLEQLYRAGTISTGKTYHY